MLPVPIERGAASFCADHTRPNRARGRAGLGEERTLGRIEHAAQHVAAGAARVLELGRDLDAESGEGIEAAKLVAEPEAALRDDAEPAPGGVADLEDLGDSLLSLAVALAADPPFVLDLDGGPPFDQLVEEHGDAVEDVLGLEARDDAGRLVALGERLEDARARRDAHVARAQEAIDLHIPPFEEGLHRRRDELVGGDDEEVGQRAVACVGHGGGDGGRGGLEPDGEEDHAACGLGFGQLERVERRVDDAHVGPFGPRTLEARAAAGHAHHVAEGGEGHAVAAGHPDGGVHHAHRRHTHGATRAAEELDRGREHRADAAAEEGHGVGAAHLHQAHRAAGQALGTLVDQADAVGDGRGEVTGRNRHSPAPPRS